MATMTSLQYGMPSLNFQQKKLHLSSNLFHCITNPNGVIKNSPETRNGLQKKPGSVVRCSSNNGIGIRDFIGGDLVKFDLGTWLSDVEEHKAIAMYSPHEGGYEGRYLNRLRYQGYHFLDVSARGLGDPETTLTKVHPVCPVSLELITLHALIYQHFFLLFHCFCQTSEMTFFTAGKLCYSDSVTQGKGTCTHNCLSRVKFHDFSPK